MPGETEPSLMTRHRLLAQSGMKLRERSPRPHFNERGDGGGARSL